MRSIRRFQTNILPYFKGYSLGFETCVLNFYAKSVLVYELYISNLKSSVFPISTDVALLFVQRNESLLKSQLIFLLALFKYFRQQTDGCISICDTRSTYGPRTNISVAIAVLETKRDSQRELRLVATVCKTEARGVA